MIKKLIILTILIASLVIIGFVYMGISEEASNKTTKEVLSTNIDTSIEYINDVEKGYQIIIFPKSKPNFKYIYLPHNKLTLKELAQSKNLTVAINGGYFTGNYTNAKHAGLLIVDRQKLVKLAMGDPQITHVAQYKDQELQFIANKEYQEDNSVDWAFQTGPLVLNNGKLETDSIKKSLNGEGEYKRTLLGKTEDKFFFVITTQTYNLSDVGNYLLGLDNFKNNTVSAINLDGGLSTAMYSRDKTNFNHNTSWFLPIIIGF